MMRSSSGRCGDLRQSSLPRVRSRSSQGIQTAISGGVFESIRVINGITRFTVNAVADVAEAGLEQTSDVDDFDLATPDQLERGRNRELVRRLRASLDQWFLGRLSEPTEAPPRPRNDPPPPRAASPGHAGGFCGGVSKPDEQGLRLRAQLGVDRVAMESVLGGALRRSRRDLWHTACRRPRLHADLSAVQHRPAHLREWASVGNTAHRSAGGVPRASRRDRARRAQYGWLGRAKRGALRA